MTGEWPMVSVSQVAIPILGGTPSRKIPDYWGGSIKWASAKDVTSAGNRYIYNTEESITEKGLHNSAAKILPKGTVVITARGTVGVLVQLGCDMSFNQTCYGLIPKNEVLQDYLYYALRGSLSTMRSLTYGTVFETITMKTFDQWQIPLPSILEQQAIACILGALDDKIELNRRMNRTLEEMARALFKSWFVDFEPVRCKAAGQSPPGLAPDIAALFPDSFEDSELGEIPKGWKLGTVGDIIEIHDSKRIPLSSRERQKRKGPYPYYGAAGIVDYVNDYLFDGIYVLIGEDGTVVTSSGNPVVQYVWGKFWVNNHAHVIKAKEPITDEQLLIMLQQIDVRPFITGAVQPKLSQTNMKTMPIVLSSDKLNQEFGRMIKPLYEKLRIIQGEIGTLAILRDTLLPKLISGEIRVPDAERIVGRCI